MGPFTDAPAVWPFEAGVLGEFGDGRLAKRHSPEQISHELTVRFPDSPSRQLAVETLYQAISCPDAMA